MHLSEMTETLAVLAPIFGVVGTVLGIAVWVMKAHIGHLRDRVAELRQSEQNAQTQLKQALADTRREELEREEAQRLRREAEDTLRREKAERERAENERGRWKQATDNYLSRARQEVARREKAEKEAAAERDAAAKAKADETTARVAATEAKEREAASLARVDAAETALNDALAAKETAQKERDEASAAAKQATERERALQEQLTAALKAKQEAESTAVARLRDLEEACKELDEARKATVTQKQDLKRYAAQIEWVTKQDGRVWSTPVAPGVKVPDFVPLAQRPQNRPIVISMLNLKGGVGKTTLTANLGSYLTYHQKKWVLLLDFDHQRSLTQSMFTTEKRQTTAKAGRTIQDFLLSDRSGKALLAAAEQVDGKGFERLSVVGNSDAVAGYGTSQNLDDLEMDLLGKWLLNPMAGDVRYLLRGAIHSAVIQERFDYVLIDCPPRLTTACINALAASDFVLIPTQAEPIAASSVSHLLRRLRLLRDGGVLPDLRVLGVLGNMVSADADTPKSREVKLLERTAAAGSKLWNGAVPLLKAKIRGSDYYPKYQHDAEVKNVIQFPAVAVEAVGKQYEKLTKEIEEYVKKRIEERIHESLGVAGVPS